MQSASRDLSEDFTAGENNNIEVRKKEKYLG